MDRRAGPAAHLHPDGSHLGWQLVRSGSVWTARLAHSSPNMIIVPLLSGVLVGDGPISVTEALLLLESIPLAAIVGWLAWSGQLSPRPAPVPAGSGSGPCGEQVRGVRARSTSPVTRVRATATRGTSSAREPRPVAP